MKRAPNGLLTGMDYSLNPSGRRRSSGARIVLSLLAVSAFGLAWLLREDVAEAAPQVAVVPVAAMPSKAPVVVAVAAAEPVAPGPIDQRADSPHPVAPSSAFMAMPTAGPAVAAPAKAIAVRAQEVSVPTTRAEKAARAEEIDALSDVPDTTLADRTVDRPATAERVEKKSSLALPKGLRLQSSVVLVVDQKTDEVIAGKNAEVVRPIASLTKLMTALVVHEARLPLDEVLEITRDDIDREKNSYSRLSTGLTFTREDLLILALMSSENRAASALGRNYPGGRSAFVQAMNRKARELGMSQTHFADSTGLSDRNVSTARDLVRLIDAAYQVPAIREFSTQTEKTVKPGKRVMHFVSSNRLVRAKNDWRIGLQKTGFTNEAGRCLVMQATVKGRPLIMVLLDSDGKLTRFADANRLRQWIESGGKVTVQKKAKKNRRASADTAGTS